MSKYFVRYINPIINEEFADVWSQETLDCEIEKDEIKILYVENLEKIDELMNGEYK